MKRQLVLMVHEDKAWLCRGEWSRPVDRNEFVTWAAYAGLELRAVPGTTSQLVLLSTNHQERLFDLMWVARAD